MSELVDCACCETMADATSRAATLISDGYYQTSRRHRRLGKLPEGVSGKDALLKASSNPSYVGLDEGSAGDQWLRVYDRSGIKVCRNVFAEFLRLGGGTYNLHLTRK